MRTPKKKRIGVCVEISGRPNGERTAWVLGIVQTAFRFAYRAVAAER